MPGENHFFEDIYARRNELGNADDSTTMVNIVERISTIYGRYNQLFDQQRIDNLIAEGLIPHLIAGSSSYKDVLDGFMEIQLEQQGKRRWGNNTPKDLFHIKEILSFYPDANILVCVRDVRDFLLSYKNRWTVTTDAHKERLKKLYHPVLTSLLWKASMKKIPVLEKQIPKGNIMIIHYEDLVTNSETVVRGICKVIGEEYVPEMLEIHTNNSSDKETPGGIFSSSIGKWHGILEPEDAAIAQWLNRDELSYLGYKQELLAVRWMVLAKLIFSFPLAIVSAFRANANNRGPLRQYLVKRISAILGR